MLNYNNLISLTDVYAIASAMNVDTNSMTRSGKTARAIAEACGTWEDDAEKQRLVDSGSVEELEDQKGACDSTRPLAALLSQTILREYRPEEILTAFYDDSCPLAKEAHRIREFLSHNHQQELVYLMMKTVKGCWSLKYEHKYFDEARAGKRWMHIGTEAQPFSNVKFDWLFCDAIANSFLGLDIPPLRAESIWRTQLWSTIDRFGGLDSSEFEQYVLQTSPEYAADGFDQAFEQLLEKLREEGRPE